MPPPLFSIVMPSLNQAEFIGMAANSVLNQSYKRVELIISDGQSNDGTLETLEAIATKHANLIWASQPDSGPADALNNALAKVRGEIIGWLNSDDLYVNGAFEAIAKAFRDNPDWIMCYGHGEHIDADGRVIGAYPTRTPDAGLASFASGCFICQPTVFFKTTMLALIGDLDASLKTAFDYDFWMRAFKAFPERIGFIDQVLAQSRLHADCITTRMRETVALEGLALGKKHLGRAYPHWATTYLEELQRETLGHPDVFLAGAKHFLQSASEHLADNQMRQLQWGIQSMPADQRQ